MGGDAMARGKKEKIKQSGADSGLGEISLGGGEGLSATIGEFLGRPEEGEKAEKKNPEASADNAGKEDKADGGATGIAEYLKSLKQATLHRESSGRGGRVVTAVSCRPEPSQKLADELARAMRKGLGCGSHVEEWKIILQGDIQDRAEMWLTKQGVKKVVMGNKPPKRKRPVGVKPA